MYFLSFLGRPCFFWAKLTETSVASAEVHHWIRALFQIVIGMFPVENYSAFQARIRKGKKNQSTSGMDLCSQIIATSHDLTPWWFFKDNPLISGKSRLERCYNLARFVVSFWLGDDDFLTGILTTELNHHLLHRPGFFLISLGPHFFLGFVELVTFLMDSTMDSPPFGVRICLGRAVFFRHRSKSRQSKLANWHHVANHGKNSPIFWGGMYLSKLAGGSNSFLYSPRTLGKTNPCWFIFFKWIETTNRVIIKMMDFVHFAMSVKTGV